MKDVPAGDYSTGQFRARTEHLTTEQLSELYASAYHTVLPPPGKALEDIREHVSAEQA